MLKQNYKSSSLLFILNTTDIQKHSVLTTELNTGATHSNSIALREAFELSLLSLIPLSKTESLRDQTARSLRGPAL